MRRLLGRAWTVAQVVAQVVGRDAIETNDIAAPPMRAWPQTRAQRRREPADIAVRSQAPAPRGVVGGHRRQLSPRLWGRYVTPSIYIPLYLATRL